LIHTQRGSTLIELLVAMPIAILLLGVVVQSLGRAGLDQQDVERRTTALDDGQIGLERMTRELRQATWLYFRSSSVVDLNVRVQQGPTASSTTRLVRWDCSGETCVRSEGPPVSYPPGAAPTFTKSQTVIGTAASDTGGRQGQIIGHDVFRPMKTDTTTGARTTEYGPDADFVAVRLRLADRSHPDGMLELQDGVTLRNRTTFSGS
jgi:type II secretory pathway pseudopilin PulG